MEHLQREAKQDHEPSRQPATDAVEKKDMLVLIRSQMEKLTSKESTCIILKLVQGKTYKEIGEITGLTTSNVGSQIHNGLKRLSAFVGGDMS